METQFKPIAMRFTISDYEEIRPILVENGIKTVPEARLNPSRHPYLVNNYSDILGCVDSVSLGCMYNNGRITFEEWDKDIFLEYCGIKVDKTKQTNKTMGYKLKVSITDVLKIHKVACSDWKLKISQNYLTRTDANLDITFTEKEIDAMFLAANSDQKQVLVEVFGEKKKTIDFDKLKTGSRVMIKYTGEHVSGFYNIDNTEPVDIVFYKTPYSIGMHGFEKSACYPFYITFHQDDKFVLFGDEVDTKGLTDCIVDVVEY